MTLKIALALLSTFPIFRNLLLKKNYSILVLEIPDIFSSRATKGVN